MENPGEQLLVSVVNCYLDEPGSDLFPVFLWHAAGGMRQVIKKNNKQQDITFINVIEL